MEEAARQLKAKKAAEKILKNCAQPCNICHDLIYSLDGVTFVQTKRNTVQFYHDTCIRKAYYDR